MKTLLLLEELGLIILGLFLCYVYNLQIAWYWWILLFFSPDISMLGYLANTTIGAFTYNLFHHKLVAIIFMVVGFIITNGFLIDINGVTLNGYIFINIGGVLLAHASFDRIFGYGLKYNSSFSDTHIGKIGKEK